MLPKELSLARRLSRGGRGLGHYSISWGVRGTEMAGRKGMIVVDFVTAHGCKWRWVVKSQREAVEDC